MIKILHYGLSMFSGGIETYLVKLWENIDHDLYQFSFVDLYEGKACFRERLEKDGCQFYNITHRRKSFYRNWKDWHQLLKKTDIDIIHCHFNTLSDIMPVLIGLQYKKRVIVHSRNSKMVDSTLTNIMHKINFLLLPRNKIKMVAVSEKAGNWLFGKNANFKIINNGLNLQRFHFDGEKRKQLRVQYHMEDKFVIGHVGVFLPVKNHQFIIRIFKEVLKGKPNAKLLFLGDGPLKNQIQNYAVELGLADSIIFLGQRTDVEDWYSVMDVLVFPSQFEGFPNVILEAQATGLPCVMSDVITQEVMVTDLCECVSLEQTEYEWAKCILQKGTQFNQNNRAKYKTIIKEKKLDVESEIMKLDLLYQKCLQKV